MCLSTCVAGRYGETLVPDVWFDAKAVWEVKAADLSISPVHCAAHGLVDPNKGISIRFPRLVRSTAFNGPQDDFRVQELVEESGTRERLGDRREGLWSLPMKVERPPFAYLGHGALLWLFKLWIFRV